MVADSQLQFTIAIPVYNGEPYIAQTLDSLLKQTYPYFNVVVLENGSTDKTVEIVQSYSDPRIRMISSGELLPIEKNWARILDIEDANEFLVLMCADDIFYPEFLNKMVELIRAEPNATLYHSHAIFIDRSGKFLGECRPAADRETADEFLDAVHDQREDVFGTGYVMRFEDFKDVGGYPQYVKLLFADIYCYYALSQKSYKACAQDALVGFRRHDSSTGFNAHPHEFDRAAYDYKNALKSSGYLGTPEREQCLHFFVRSVERGLRKYVHELIKGRSDPGEDEFFQEIRVSLSDTVKHRAVYPWDVPLNWYLNIATISNYVIRNLVFYLIIAGVRLRYTFYLMMSRRRKYKFMTPE